MVSIHKIPGKLARKAAFRVRSSLLVGFDRDFYLRTNPDVAEAGINPMRHYLERGKRERRAKNAKEWERLGLGRGAAVADPSDHTSTGAGGVETATAKASGASSGVAGPPGFDAAWYLARHPDVLLSGQDPLKHYLEHGMQEGRAGSPASQFDAAFYVRQNPDVAHAGMDPLTHYLEHGMKEGRPGYAGDTAHHAFAVRSGALAAEWADRFDAAWYLGRNPDVVELGIDPFTHFLTQGLLENRRPGPSVPLEYIAVLDARIRCLKAPTIAKEVSLFVAHSPHGTVKPNVPEYLRQLKANGVSTILLVAADVPFKQPSRELLGLVDGLYVRDNVGYDFAIWAHALHLLPQLWKCDLLYFMNDSIVGPTSEAAFSTLLDRIRRSSADMIGLTENIDRGWHLQSYFLAFKREALRSAAMRRFVEAIVNLKRKDDVVNEYETRFAATLRSAGLRCEALFPMPGQSNPTLYRWRDLVADGYPFAKLSTIRQDVPTVYAGDWREVLERAGYDSAIGDRCLEDFWRWMPPPAGSADPHAHRQNCRNLADFHAFMAGRTIITLPRAETPDVSVVLVLSDGAPSALRSLQELSDGLGEMPLECILVNDTAQDDVSLLLQRVRGATVLDNGAVLGFQRAVNRAAVRARGRWLLLLAAGARFPKGLADALDWIVADRDVAAAGGPVSTPDGTLVNAGTIVWSNGTSTAFGAGRQSDEREFAYRREVDALSHQLLLLRRDLFDEAGRLDPAFRSPNAAIADLCLNLRRDGHAVIYEPRLGTVSGRGAGDTGWGEADRTALEDRHRVRLMKEHCPPGADLLLARSRDRDRIRLLFLVESVPSDLLCLEPPPMGRLIAACRHSGFGVTIHTSNAGFREMIEHGGLNASVEHLDDASCEDVLWTRRGHYHGIVVAGPDLLARVSRHFQRHMDDIRNTKVIYDAGADARARLFPKLAICWPGTGTVQSDVADLTFAANDEQRDVLSESGFRNVHTIASIEAPSAEANGFAERVDVLIAGTFDRDEGADVPNLFAFVEKALPSLSEGMGRDVRVHVVGPTGSRRLLGLRHARVVVHGDDRAVLDRMRTARILVLLNASDACMAEATATGLPVVHFDASDVQAFVSACTTLYRDEAAWTKARDAMALERGNEGATDDAAASEAAALIGRLFLASQGGAGSPVSGDRSRFDRDANGMRRLIDGGKAGVATSRAAPLRPSAKGFPVVVDLSVIYLARGADDGSARSFERFRDSYLQHEPGIEHDLVVILKGFDDPKTEKAAETLFTRLGARILRLPDDGLDVGAYIRASNVVRSEYLCFLNTHAEVLCDGWLRLLAERFVRPEVGLVGATGSFEALEFFEGASVYPNIHLRSNAFMMPRKLFREVLGGRSIRTKEDAYGVENGPASLTRQVLARGLEVLVVGRNGRSYPPQWWPSSDTFRQGRQDNLIVGDNQTRWYETADAPTRQMLFGRAWGGHVDPNDLPVPIETARKF